MTQVIQKCAVVLNTIIFVSILNANAFSNEVFESDTFGFKFNIPDGFKDYSKFLKDSPLTLPDGTPMGIALFAKELTDSEELIEIRIERLGQLIDPSQQIDLSQVPQEDGLSYSLDSLNWQGTELTIIKQDITVEGQPKYTSYIVQFPLRAEAVQLRVVGLSDSESEISDVFLESVQALESTSAHITSIERNDFRTGSVRLGKLIMLLVWTFTAGVAYFFIVRHIQGPDPQRHFGIILISFIGLFGSIHYIGQHILWIIEALSDAEGRVTASRAYTINLIGNVSFSLFAIAAFVGLLLGKQWGWWAAMTYWIWRICHQVAVPVVATYLPGPEPKTINGEPVNYLTAALAMALCGMLIAYLCKNSVRNYCKVAAQRLAFYLLTLFSITLTIEFGLNLLTRFAMASQ